VTLGIYAVFNFPVSFDSATWKTAGGERLEGISDWDQFGLHTPIRKRMRASLLHRYDLSQMTSSEINALLGGTVQTYGGGGLSSETVVIFSGGVHMVSSINRNAPPPPGDKFIGYNLGEDSFFDTGIGYFWKYLQIEFIPDGKEKKVTLIDVGS